MNVSNPASIPNNSINNGPPNPNNSINNGPAIPSVPAVLLPPGQPMSTGLRIRIQLSNLTLCNLVH